MFIFSFKNSNRDTTKDFFDEYYMSLVVIKDFNVLIDNKPFFNQSVKINKKRMQNLSKCQEILIIQQEID